MSRPKVEVTLAYVIAFVMCGLSASAQNSNIFLITTNKSAQTGFRLKGTKGIITALHGVAGRGTITVTGFDQRLKDHIVTIYQFDAGRDLARLSSPEWESRSLMEGLEAGDVDKLQQGMEVKVIGYPTDISQQEIEIPLHVGNPPKQVLGLLAGDSLGAELSTRKSPDLKLKTLYVNGTLGPGHSGAPILREHRVVAVGNGGLGIGRGVGWGIRLEKFDWKKASGNAELKRIEKLPIDALFSSDTEPMLAKARLMAALEKRVSKLEISVSELQKIILPVIKELEKELRPRDGVLGGSDTQNNQSNQPRPSTRAVELATLIPDSSGEYALGLKATALSRFDDARTHLETAKNQQGLGLARILFASGQNEFYDGKYPAAIREYRAALTLLPDDISIQNSLALSLIEAKGYEEAKKILDTLRAELESDPRHSPTDLAAVLNNISIVLYIEGKFPDAAKTLNSAWDIRKRALGETALETLAVANNYAAIQIANGKPQEALTILQKVAKHREDLLGKMSLDLAVTLNNIGVAQHVLGNDLCAEETWKRCLDIRQSQLGSEHPETVTCLINWVAALTGIGKIDLAILQGKRSVELAKKVLGPNSLWTATASHNLAEIYSAQNKFDLAIPLLSDALTIRDRTLPEDHIDTLATIAALAGAHFVVRNNDEAARLYGRAYDLAIQEKRAPNPNLPLIMNNIANYYYNVHTYDRAELLYRRAIPMAETIYTRGHKHLAQLFNNEGVLFHTQKKYDDAERDYTKGLSITYAVGSELSRLRHQLVAYLTSLYITQQRYADAEVVLLKILDLAADDAVSLTTENLRRTYELGIVYSKWGKWVKAEEPFRIALELALASPSVTDQQKSFYANNLIGTLEQLRKKGEADKLRLLFPLNTP